MLALKRSSLFWVIDTDEEKSFVRLTPERNGESGWDFFLEPKIQTIKIL